MRNSLIKVNLPVNLTTVGDDAAADILGFVP